MASSGCYREWRTSVCRNRFSIEATLLDYRNNNWRNDCEQYFFLYTGKIKNRFLIVQKSSQKVVPDDVPNVVRYVVSFGEH